MTRVAWLACGLTALVPALAFLQDPDAPATTKADGPTAQLPSAHPDSGATPADSHAACEARIAELTAELRHERELRLDREREWLRYTQRMARLMELAGAPQFQADVPDEMSARVPAEERESRALGTDPERAPVAGLVGEAPSAREPDTQPVSASPAGPQDPTRGSLDRVARLAREERSRAVFLALRSLFTIEQVSGIDLLESGTVTAGATGPVVLRVLDEAGRPLGSLYAERMRLEGSHAARTLSLVLENGWERRAGAKMPFPGGEPDAEGRGGYRRIELAHVDPTPWFEALPELFREDQREAVTQGDPRALSALRFDLNQRLRTDATANVYRLESLSAVQGVVLREVHLAVLTPDLALERELFADSMSILRAEKGLEIVLEGGSQVRGSQKVPFLDGRYRIFLPQADATVWEAAGIPLGRRPALAPPNAIPAGSPAGDAPTTDDPVGTAPTGTPPAGAADPKDAQAIPGG